MKSIGQTIKESRIAKKITLSELSAITKIKKEFIKAIEEESWTSLPEYPVTVGFVKNLSRTLDLNDNTTVALLRRDYRSPKELRINPKPDVAKEFIWSPKLTFFVGVALTVVAVFAYLILQYLNFNTPPRLIIDFPKEGAVVTEKNLEVKGSTDPESTLKVNNQPVILDSQGFFSTEIEVFEGTKEVVVVAKSRSGKETVITRKIEVKVGSEK